MVFNCSRKGPGLARYSTVCLITHVLRKLHTLHFLSYLFPERMANGVEIHSVHIEFGYWRGWDWWCLRQLIHLGRKEKKCLDCLALKMGNKKFPD